MLIKNGTIIDGRNTERFKADIRIEQDKIKDIGKLKARNKEPILDAAGQFVVPGFIDILNRSDIHLSLFEKPGLNSLLKQGITTIVGGGCGSSLAPLASQEAIRAIQKWKDISKVNINWENTGELLEEIERHKISLNFATLTGHATIRRGIIGDNFQNLSESEMKKAEYLLEKSIDEGSFGLSTGLSYSHARVAPPDELNRLAKTLKRTGGIYATHLRDEGAELSVSINETISIARSHGIPSHIFHFKALGRENWQEFPRALEMIAHANKQGANISFDIYPYTKTASVLYLILPDWASDGGKKEVLVRLRDKPLREKIAKELDGEIHIISQIIIASGELDRNFIGKTIGAIAHNQETSVIETFINIILASKDQVIGFIPAIDEKNIRLGIVSPFGFFASDGSGYTISDRRKGALVHPRSFGAFTKVLGRYVKDLGILNWESAIHKMTSQPSESLGLKNRGQIKKGYFADIVIFDPQKVAARATFKDPFQYSRGINHVFVNGGISLKDGKFQKKRWGRVLRK